MFSNWLNTSVYLRFLGGLLAMLLSLGCDPRGSRPPASSVKQASVHDDIRDLYNAIYAGDVETIWKSTHPKITAITVEMAGGVSEAKAALQASLDRGKSIPMELESLSFPSPPTYLKGETNEFVIIPTLCIIKGNDRRMESLNYQLGARPIGSTKWLYIEGSRIGPDNVHELFPDFPADYTFPTFYRKQL